MTTQVQPALTTEQLDDRYPILPGDSGEHDFKVNATQAETLKRLSEFASECGGLAFKRGNEIHLCASQDEWILEYDEAGEKLLRIYTGEPGEEGLEKGDLYWDSEKPRKLFGSLQTGNAYNPTKRHWEILQRMFGYTCDFSTFDDHIIAIPKIQADAEALIKTMCSDARMYQFHFAISRAVTEEGEPRKAILLKDLAKMLIELGVKLP